MATPLHDLLAARAPGAAAALGEPGVAEATLGALCEQAAAAWPGIAVEPVALIGVLADKLAGTEAPALTPDALAELHLAIACARGDGAAIAAFERA